MSDVDRKLGRAEHHRDELATLLGQYRDSKPYRVDERADESRGKPYRVVYAHALEPVPDNAALIFGDVVQNLRATLDYLIGALRPGGPTRFSQFPICPTTDCFESAKGSDLVGVGQDMVTVIESMQAYGQTPDPATASQLPADRLMREHYRPLRWLQTFWNIDKHRALAATPGWVVSDWATHNRPPGEDSGIGYRVDFANARAEWWVPIDEHDPYLDAHFEVRVLLRPPSRGFHEDWPGELVDVELDDLAGWLCRIVRWSVLPAFGKHRID
jgi:hypothetical protein